jgi:hypothetical protein
MREPGNIPSNCLASPQSRVLCNASSIMRLEARRAGSSPVLIPDA